MKNTARIEDQLKEDAMAIYREALVAVEPSRAVEKSLEKTDDTLKILKGKRAIKTLDLNKFERIFIVGGGKATAPMAQAVEQILGPRITDGVISVKYGHGLKLKKTTVLEAGHPVPDEAGVEAAWKIKDLLSQTTKKDLVFSLISGGGSALLPLPAQGLKLSEKQTVTKMLLNCGADIHEMNVVRKHLSQIKGGQMARLAAPATVVNLMLSDVVGDSMDTIASGPFVPDKSTFEEVAIIFARYKLMKKIPAAVRNHLIKKGLTGQLEETPKPGAPEFKQVTNLVVGSNFHCLKASRRRGQGQGVQTAPPILPHRGRHHPGGQNPRGHSQGSPGHGQSGQTAGLHHFRRRNHGDGQRKGPGRPQSGIRPGRGHGNRWSGKIPDFFGRHRRHRRPHRRSRGPGRRHHPRPGRPS